MFIFKADNMLLHQLHSIPELQLQNIRMAPQKKPKNEKKTKKNTKKTQKKPNPKKKKKPTQTNEQKTPYN